MIIREDSELGRHTLILDKHSLTTISHVRWYDTETLEAEIYVLLSEKKLEDTSEPLFIELRGKYKDLNVGLLGDGQFEKRRDKSVKVGRGAIYDRNRNGGKIMPASLKDPSQNSNNEMVMAIVTLRNSVAIDRRTGEEIE